MTSYPAGCYGKLPIFGDFLRHNWQGPELQALDQWFQEGIYLGKQTLAAAWDATYDKMPPTRFVFRPGGSAKCLVGVAVPGRDQVGRKYPFAIFLTVDAASLERDAAMLPAMFAPFFDAAQDLALKGWIGGDAKTLLAKVDALKAIDLPAAAASRAKYDEFLRGEKCADFWPDIFGSFDNVGKYVLVQNLLDAVGMVKNAPAGKATIGLKFPLPASLDRGAKGFEASVWLDLALRLTKRPGVPTLAFWSQRGSDHDPCLLIFFTLPSPRCFVPLLKPAHDSDHVWDLGKGDASRAQQARGLYGPALDNKELPLTELVAKVGS